MSKTLAEIMLPEFDQEMERTRKLLTAVTPESMSYQLNEQFRSVQWNVNHLADIVAWTPMIIAHPEFDIAPVDGPAYDTPDESDPATVLATFNTNVSEAHQALEATSDETLAEDWSLKSGGQTLFTIAKGECVRTWVINHTIHHRAILSIYLRMQGIEITPVYDG